MFDPFSFLGAGVSLAVFPLIWVAMGWAVAWIVFRMRTLFGRDKSVVSIAFFHPYWFVVIHTNFIIPGSFVQYRHIFILFPLVGLHNFVVSLEEQQRRFAVRF